MSRSYVLFTGATGGTGAIVLAQLLEAGHSVNAVLRSFSKSKAGLTAQYKREVDSGKLTFTEIPDMAVTDAFHDAAKGASAIVHVATPISDDDFEEKLIKPSFTITDNVLRAAKAAPSVKRVVITGSVVSVVQLPEGLFSGRTFSEKDFNPITRDAAKDQSTAYQYSKVSSEQAAWEFMEKEKPGFDLVYILAPLITGRSTQVGFKPEKSAMGGVGVVYRELFDRKEPGFLFPFYMDVHDVAANHVKALSSSIPGNERYLFRAPGLLNTPVVANKVREAMPELRDRVPAGDESKEIPESLAKLDTSKADKYFGTQWRGWWETIEETIKDLIEHE